MIISTLLMVVSSFPLSVFLYELTQKRFDGMRRIYSYDSIYITDIKYIRTHFQLGTSHFPTIKSVECAKWKIPGYNLRDI